MTFADFVVHAFAMLGFLTFLLSGAAATALAVYAQTDAGKALLNRLTAPKPE